jgi:pilus assembly protein CpaC
MRLLCAITLICCVFECHAVIKVKQFYETTITLPAPARHVGVVNPKIANVHLSSPTMLHIYGESPGITSVYATGDQQKVLFRSEIRVKTNLQPLKQDIKRIAPDVRIRTLNTSILLSGSVASPKIAEQLMDMAKSYASNEQIINHLEVRSSVQVNLRVRVAEIARNSRKELGIKWNNILRPDNFVIGLATNFGKSFSETSQASLTYRDKNYDINGVVDALAAEGFVTILAEPDLTATSGETASFLAGGEFPVPIVTEDHIDVTYKEFGVRLSFTPTVIDRNRIQLKVRPEVSEISQANSVTINGFVIPGLKVRRTETTVELGSGQSFAIAGLLQNETSSASTGFPKLKDLPVLGPLFRSTRFNRRESELAIIVTPYIVKPITASQKPMTPIDDFIPALDIDLLYKQKFMIPAEQAGRADFGPIGFIIDMPRRRR